MFTDINEALEWVMSRHSRGHEPAYFLEVLHAAGDPQDKIRTVHVAGTNGKGSFVNYLADICSAAGLKTGTYTSPHLVSHLDRIRIGGSWIPAETYLTLLAENMECIEDYDLSMFEIDTLIMFLWFSVEKVDLAVIECGLGGLHDTTNVLKHPALSVITTIGMDHTERLGGTPALIAAQKAGIMRPGCPVLTGRITGEAMAVIREHAVRTGCPLYETEKYEDAGSGMFILAGTRYRLATKAGYQKDNAAQALTAAKLLGIDITAAAVAEAVEKSTWAGRFEKVADVPVVILDGAHNVPGMEALSASLSVLPRPLIGVFSALKDKEGPRMAAMLAEKCDRLIITQFAMYRADSAEHLAGSTGEVIGDWREAITEAVRAAGKNGSVIIAGSLYFISLVRSGYFARQQ